MINITKSKHITMGLIFAFLIFSCPYLLTAKAEKVGNLEGFVYGIDGTSPVEGAVIKIKNIGDGTVYESDKSDMYGAFKIEGIREGLYVAGITSSSVDFNSNGLIGIKSNETAKASFSLHPPEEEVSSSNKFVSEKLPPKTEIRIGKVVEYNADTMEASIFIEEGELNVGDTIRIKGFTSDFYQKVERLKLATATEEGIVGFQEMETVNAGQTPIIEVENPVQVGDFVYLVLKKKRLLAFFTHPCAIAALIGVVIITTGTIEEEPEVSPFM